MKINNKIIDSIDFLSNEADGIKDILIFAIGYEDRCLSILKDYFLKNSSVKLPLIFSDYQKYESAISNKKFCVENQINPTSSSYDEPQVVIKYLKETINKVQNNHEKINIHVDYSSMPRSWYCSILISMKMILRQNDLAYFWYSQGDYEEEIDEGNITAWPYTGIEDFYVFNGRVSLRPTNNRSHIIGLGFDYARSSAIYSVLDPSCLVLSYSYVQGDIKMRHKLKKLNKSLDALCSFSITLPVDDFSFSISKLYETVKELHCEGDVILVPDGPKTQILASSLIPELFEETGVVCLHVRRNGQSFEHINIKPTGKVFGFSLKYI